MRNDVRRCRALVLVAAVLALLGKLALAITTYGTNDITHWLDFLHGVRQSGPIGIYSYPFTNSLYNHPPLIGYYLEMVGVLTHVGLTPQFTIRAVASLADVVTDVVVFAMVARRRSLREATAAGIIVALSPILIIISGFHGNTDPIFTMLTLLSVYLLADRQRPTLAGGAMALAVGIKIVPVVAVPCLLIYALRRGRSVFARFAAACAVVSAVFWLPALIEQLPAIRRNVLGYSGVNAHEWGIDLLGAWAGHPAWARFMEGSGRLLIVAACAIVPAYLAWRRPQMIAEAVCLALAAFLALTPTFGTQYLAWGAAAVFLLSFRSAVIFNVLGGLLLIHVYNRWSSGLPWYHAHAGPFTPGENVFGLLVWASLCCAVVFGAVRMFQAPSEVPTARQPSGPAARAEVAQPVPASAAHSEVRAIS